MTTKYIDPAFHGASFPASYVPPGNLQALGCTATSQMLIGNVVSKPGADVLSGYFTSDGSTMVIPVGFAATKIKIINWTDGLQWEWMYGAPATDSIKITDATPAIATDTNSQIVITADAAGGNGDVASVTLGATLCGSAKVLSYRIEA